ncbi:MAG: hypothetical protein ABIB97_00075 [Patescibacteria group bacterium]
MTKVKTTYTITVTVVVIMVIALVYYFTTKEAGETNQNVNANNNIETIVLNQNVNQAVVTNTYQPVEMNVNTNQAVEEIEEAETSDGTDFTETGNLTGDSITSFTLVYEEPGNPALTALLNFDYPGYTSSCTIDGVPMTCQEAIDQEFLVAGDLVTVTGTDVGDGEVVVTMLDK